MERDARNATLTFQTVQRQEQTALSRKADLLASLAFMRGGDASAITDASEDPWQSEDCNLFLLADRSGKIVALNSTGPSMPLGVAQELVSRSVKRGETSGWWFGKGALYQVVLHPYDDGSPERNLLGTVVVGHWIDARAAGNFGRIASSEIVFRHGDEVAVSTLSLYREMEFAREIHGLFETTQLHLGGERFYARSLELTPGLQPATQLIVLKSYAEAEAYLGRLNHLLLGVGLVAILLGGVLIFFISDTVTRPLASLVEGVHALERGDYKYPLGASGHDELSQLTFAFDDMRNTLLKNKTQREQLEGQLRQSQKMEALGRLAGSVAHDFNNLLTVIRGHSELLLDRLRPSDALYRNPEQIRKAADRAAALTRQMLAFSRMQVLQPTVLDLNELITDMSKLLRRLIREDIEFNLRLGESLANVKADPGQIEQVLLNLTVNASDAMPLGGHLTIETHNIIVDWNYTRTRPGVDPGAYVVVSVSDTGHGMDAATKARIFEPFFTTKEPGKGTGLGLATVYGVVKQSGGYIWVESAPDQGSRFEIYLPQTTEPAPTRQTLTIANESAAQRKTVLVVEDEQEVRELACEFLKAAGYTVLTAENGLEGLEIAKQLGKSIHVVLTDIVMPKMRGPALADQLKHLLPHVKIVYMTGYFDQKGDSENVLQDGYFLQKPFSREAVVAQIREALRNEPSASRMVQNAPVN